MFRRRISGPAVGWWRPFCSGPYFFRQGASLLFASKKGVSRSLSYVRSRTVGSVTGRDSWARSSMGCCNRLYQVRMDLCLSPSSSFGRPIGTLSLYCLGFISKNHFLVVGGVANEPLQIDLMMAAITFLVAALVSGVSTGMYDRERCALL